MPKPRCSNCEKELSHYESKRCMKCNGLYKIGNKNPSWKGGKPKCIICGITLGCYTTKRCRNCWKKSGKNYGKEIPKCIDCGKIIKYESRRCNGCNHKDPQFRKNISKKLKGEKSPFWKGNNVKYSGVHEWIRNNWTKKKICDFCGKMTCKIEWACIDGCYTKEKEHWKNLCIACHRKLDKIPTGNKIKKWFGDLKSYPKLDFSKPKDSRNSK